MNDLKKNWPVLLAFALPLALIFGVAAFAYIPSLFLSTQYDFIYATCNDGRDYYFYCNPYLNDKYAVQDGKLLVRAVDPQKDYDGDKRPEPVQSSVTRIFLHETSNNQSREISAEDAQKLQLSNLITSPDGVSVRSLYDQSDEFFLFFGGSSQHGYYLTKGNQHRRLNLINDDTYYFRDNFKFLGWITK